MAPRPRIAMLLHRSLEHDARVRREAAALRDAGWPVTVLETDPGIVWRLPLRVRQVAMMGAAVVAVLRERPRIVHAHDAAMLLPGLLGARLVGASLVYDSHELSSGVAYRRGALKRVVDLAERFAAPRASAVITVSESIARRLQAAARLDRTPAVVRNVCALDRPGARSRGALRARLGLRDEPLVLHQGAAAPARGCATLVRALAAVPSAQLVFLGDADPSAYGAELAALARSCGVSERVHFHPSVPLDELLAHTADADVGVVLFEPDCENYRLTLPNKLFEYLAAGVPVLGSAVPEIGGVIERYGVGWTVDPGDPAAVAAALRVAVREAHGPVRERVRAADAELGWDREQRVLLEAYDGLAAA